MPTINPLPLKTGKLGQIIRNWRKSNGYTQKLICGHSNIGNRFLSELERGKESAEIGLVLKVLCNLGLDVLVVPRTARYTGAYQELYEIMMNLQENKDIKPVARGCNL